MIEKMTHTVIFMLMIDLNQQENVKELAKNYTMRTDVSRHTTSIVKYQQENQTALKRL